MQRRMIFFLICSAEGFILDDGNRTFLGNVCLKYFTGNCEYKGCGVPVPEYGKTFTGQVYRLVQNGREYYDESCIRSNLAFSCSCACTKEFIPTLAEYYLSDGTSTNFTWFANLTAVCRCLNNK